MNIKKIKTKCSSCGIEIIRRRRTKVFCDECKRKKAVLRTRIFREANPKIIKERKKIFYIKHKDRILDIAKKQYPFKKEIIKERVAEYRKINHKEIVIKKKQHYLKDRERVILKSKEWYKKNKDKKKETGKEYRSRPEIKKRILERNRIREALLRSFYNTTDITIDYLIQLRKDTPNCAICNRLLTNKKGDAQAHLDHIFPLCMGGKHKKVNVRFVCRKCNLSRPKNGSDILLRGGKTLLI